MTEHWIISVPGNPQQSKLDQPTTGNGLSKNFKFNIPDLKVGTLDALIGLSDDLGKVDTLADSLSHKLSNYLAEVLEADRDKHGANLKVNGKSYEHYIREFQWNPAKYPTKQHLHSVYETIAKMLSHVDGELRTRQTAFNNLKANLQNMERKSSGSLLMKNLSQVVKKNDVIHDSEYLETLIVAVPLGSAAEWEKMYLNVIDWGVVPKSSRLIARDSEYALYGVTVFKKIMSDFKNNCQKHKFFVRDFKYIDASEDSDQNEKAQLTTSKNKMQGPLIKWLKVNFSEVFMAWMHIKALRVFVESVLRYGLPVNFQSTVIEPASKSKQKKLRNVLDNLYRDLDNSGLGPSNAEDDAMPGLSIGLQEYFPYVSFTIVTDFHKH